VQVIEEKHDKQKKYLQKCRYFFGLFRIGPSLAEISVLSQLFVLEGRLAEK